MDAPVCVWRDSSAFTQVKDIEKLKKDVCQMSHWLSWIDNFVRVHPAVPRNVLGGLLGFGALNAFGGGYYGMSGAKDIPVGWLRGSSFSSYFIPSLILFTVVGGSLLAAAIAIFAKLRMARWIAFGAGAIVLGWLVVQLVIIGFVSWLQPTTAIAGFLILFLTWRLPNRMHP